MASLANALGLFYAGGGGQSVGNVVLISIRIEVRRATGPVPQVAGRPLRAAMLARAGWAMCGSSVAGARLSDRPDERAAQPPCWPSALAGMTDPRPS